MTIKTHGRMMTDNTIGITELDITDGTANQAIVTDGQGVMRFATVGAGGSVGSSVYVEDIRDGDGTTTTFTLSTAAPYEESLLAFIDGVAQPTSSFTLPTTTSITFTPAPGNGADIRICHLGIASSIADCSVTGAKICMGGDTTGDVLFYNGTAYQRLVIGTAGQHLATNSAANAPEWVTVTHPTQGVTKEEIFIVPEATTYPTFINGPWTRPAGVTSIEVSLVGGGGSGGDGEAGNGTGGNGGAGGFVQRVFDVTNISSIDYSLGVNGRKAFFGSNGTASINPLSVTVVGGAITAIAISADVGELMTIPPLIVIEPNADSATGRDGAGATAIATISGGSVTSISVTNGGSGYVSGQVSAFYGIYAYAGANGTAGTASPSVDGTDGADGMGHGNIGNEQRMKSGPSRPGVGGVGTQGSSLTAGTHSGMYIRSYR